MVQCSIPLRTEMNELVDLFNNVQEDVITHYPRDQSNSYYVHHLNVSDEFASHRFCEGKHNETDQWVSSDVWIWNLQYNDGNTGGTDKPPDAPNATAIPVMSLDTQNITWVDDLFFNSSLLPPNGSLLGGPSQSGFGWTSRLFHPKPLGYERMKNFFIQRLKDDEIPGVIDMDQVPPPANATTLSSSSATSSQSSSTTAPSVISSTSLTTTSSSVAATTSPSDLNICIACSNPNASDGGCPPDHPTAYPLENAGTK